MSQLETKIRWRPYPEQKPEKNGIYIVLYDDEQTGDVTVLVFGAEENSWWSPDVDGKPDYDFDHSEYVLAFALPEDIVTVPAPKEPT